MRIVDTALDIPEISAFQFLTENPFTQRSESQIREQHNEIEFFRMTF